MPDKRLKHKHYGTIARFRCPDLSVGVRGKRLTVNQPPHGFAGSSPASPTSLRSLRELRLGRPAQLSRSEVNEGCLAVARRAKADLGQPGCELRRGRPAQLSRSEASEGCLAEARQGEGQTRSQYSELQLPPFADRLRLCFLGLLNQDAAKFIDPPGEVQGVFLQYLHGAAIVTLVFQFGDTLVEGVQFLFQLLDRALDRKFSSGKFPGGSRFRAVVKPATRSISLCSHHH
jgi:hypothetical protein